MKNFWKLKSFSIFSVNYAYVDHYSYQADQLFVENMVKVKFNREYSKEESPYHIIFCKVAKRDINRFEDALNKLANKMLLLGYRDYPDICNELTKIIYDETGAMKINETICTN